MTTRTAQWQQDRRDTWPQVLKYNHEKYADRRRAMRQKLRGTWRSFSWQDYYRDVKYLALGLLSLGFVARDKVLIIGNNAPQWYYAELAAQANRGVAVGVHPSLTPSETKHISENSEARFAIVEDQEQVDKLLESKDELPLLEKVIYWNYKGLAHYDDPILMGYRQVLQLGEQYEKERPGLFEHSVETGRTDDICVIVYTSGAAGAVRGAAHTYRTMSAVAVDYLQDDRWYETDNVVPYLPPVSTVEQCFGIACHLLSACTLNFAEAPETYRRDAREISPQIVSRQARLWESQAKVVRARILDSDVIKRLAFRLCMPIGYRMAGCIYRKQKPNLFLKLLYALANIVLFKPIRGNLGLSNARICYSSGDKLNPDTMRFYHALALSLIEIEEVVG